MSQAHLLTEEPTVGVPAGSDAFGDEQLPSLPEAITLPDVQALLDAIQPPRASIDEPTAEGETTPQDDIPTDALSVRSDLEDTRRDMSKLEQKLAAEVQERERLSTIVAGFQADLTAVATQLQTLTLAAKRLENTQPAPSTSSDRPAPVTEDASQAATGLQEVLARIQTSRESSATGLSEAQLANIIKVNKSGAAAAPNVIRKRN